MDMRLDDLSGPEMHALLRDHLDDMLQSSPAECVHAFDVELRRRDVTLWSAWSPSNTLLGCGA